MNEQTPRASSLKRRKNQVKRGDYDTTELNLERNGGYTVHRDYAAHLFRFGFASRYCYGKRVLELGCGSRSPLAHTLMHGTSYKNPEQYVGIDFGGISKQPGMKWAAFHERTDATSLETRNMLLDTYGPFDVIVSFEVIEHMPVESGARLLENVAALLAEDGCALISTPVFNGHRAVNHVHEYTIDELAGMFNNAGLKVADRMGTFMSVPDLEKVIVATYDRPIADAIDSLIKRCSVFYGNDVLANWFAPAFPDHSRNNVWKVVKA